METLALTALFIFLAAGLVLEFFGFYGTLVVMISSAFFAAVTHFQTLTVKTLIVLLILYLMGEALEYLLVLIGARRFGASRRAAFAAVVGGLLGAVMGFMVGVVGAFPGALVGMFFGAFLMERSLGKDLKQSLRSGAGSLAGRLGAIICKVLICSAMIALVCITLWSTRAV